MLTTLPPLLNRTICRERILFRRLSSNSLLQTTLLSPSRRFSSSAPCEYENIVSKDPNNYPRWKQIPAAFLNHVALGSVFAWSMLNEPMTRLLGVVAPAPSDWTMSQVTMTFSLIMGGFAWGAVFGKHVERWGPRKSCLVGASCLGTGFALASYAVHSHNLYLLYLAGSIWGAANGFSYVPPVTTLMKWFPDRKGFASGACITGFAGGSVVAAPMYSSLMSYFREVPTYLGQANQVTLVNEGGKLLAQIAGKWQEVVVATAADVKLSGLAEGVYLVGTGSTGLAPSLMVLGVSYASIMAICSFTYRLPPVGFVPISASIEKVPVDSARPVSVASAMATHDIDLSVASRSRQFWLMYAGFGLSITGAYGCISMQRTMLTEAFVSTYPSLVTAAFATTFVALTSSGNLGGRIVWPNLADFFVRRSGSDPLWGRRRTFALMWGICPPLYLSMVWAVHNQSPESTMPVVVFTAAVIGILSVFGGTTASRPPLVADMFGTKNAGIITARQLSVVLPAAYLGPKLCTHFRDLSIHDAMCNLSRGVDNAVFEATFGMGKEGLPTLIKAKTVTINRLLEICPPGTLDPSPFVFDNALYVCAGLQSLAFFTNMAMRPMDPKYHLNASQPPMTPADLSSVGKGPVVEASGAEETDEEKPARQDDKSKQDKSLY